MLRRAVCLGSAIALLVVCPAPGSAPAATRVGFWAGEEFAGAPSGYDATGATYWKRRDTRAFTPELWRVLAAERVPLYLHLRYRRDFGPPPEGERRRRDALPLLRRAERLGIPVWAWIVVPYGRGYWSWEGNAAVTRRALASFRGWARRNALRFRGVAIDSEPSVQETVQLYGAFGGSGDLFAYLDQTVDPARQCLAIDAYRRLIDWARGRGVRVVAAAYPPVLDDLPDGSIALQDALDVVTLPPESWSTVYFMAYRSLYAQLFGADPGSGLVSSYFRSAAEALGPRGQITLGVAGADPYLSAGSLAHDVRVLATLGARTVPVYSLETTAAAFGVDGVAEVVSAARRPFGPGEAATQTADTPATIADRSLLAGLDASATAGTPLITADGPSGPQAANPYAACGGA